MTDLAERLEALAERNDGPIDVKLTDDEAKERFLTALEAGKTPPEAAELTGRTSTWFRRRRNPRSRNYDAIFSAMYDEITAPGGSYNEGLGLRGLMNLAKESDRGNVRASEKLIAAYHADFGWMKAQTAQGALNVEQLQVFFGELPLEKLLELQEARKQAKARELPVIDQ